MLAPAEQIDGLRRAADRARIAVGEILLPESGYAQADGLLLHYLDWGGDHATAVIFLHGARLTAHTWDLVCLSLRDSYRCIALDLRGHGDSGWSERAQYSIGAHVDDIDRVVAAIGAPRVVVVGHSRGGTIAAAFAEGRPNVVQALVVVDSGPHLRPSSGAERIRQFATRTRELRTLDAFVAEAVAFNPARDPESLRYSLRHNLRPTTDGGLAWKYDPRGFEPGVISSSERAAVWKAAETIACPTLIVRGGASDVFSEEGAGTLAALLPHGELVTIDGAGHSVQGDRPRELATAIRSFLDRRLASLP